MAKKNNKSNKKRQLSQEQEFAIMKMVLDKFLWLGLAVMVVGLYHMSMSSYIPPWLMGISYMIVGAVVLGLFGLILIREYEFMH